MKRIHTQSLLRRLAAAAWTELNEHPLLPLMIACALLFLLNVPE